MQKAFTNTDRGTIAHRSGERATIFEVHVLFSIFLSSFIFNLHPCSFVEILCYQIPTSSLKARKGNLHSLGDQLIEDNGMKI